MTTRLCPHCAKLVADELVPAFERARAAWGSDLPDWVEALARELDRSGFTGLWAGRRAILSPAVTRCTIENRLPPHIDTTSIEARVRAALMVGEIEGLISRLNDGDTHA
ncbi:hypothetical protein [Nitrobacter winogradskyi]|uniref:Uncharacterized protein n=2 Tax=Nitrobacter winogradskyi TaxID=913 RepID=A0ACC6AIY9_NITWI|nr:hypothetical protein [Nitrobacter winogradskyi]MCP1998830.1 hypothetical protein [Nitrobacter winogradskyi]GEC14249.1 hypothetical protein NWI01_01410 [Nitrobacter winogradskyi]